MMHFLSPMSSHVRYLFAVVTTCRCALRITTAECQQPQYFQYSLQYVIITAVWWLTYIGVPRWTAAAGKISKSRPIVTLPNINPVWPLCNQISTVAAKCRRLTANPNCSLLVRRTHEDWSLLLLAPNSNTREARSFFFYDSLSSGAPGWLGEVA
jgi:hypothetical protein